MYPAPYPGPDNAGGAFRHTTERILKMLTFEQLKTRFESMRADVESAQVKLRKLDTQIQQIKLDGTRHPDYVREKVDELRKSAIPAIAELVRTFDGRLAEISAQKKFWESKTLLLSLQLFDPDPAKDAVIRLARIQELAMLNGPQLQLAGDNAVAENNLPLLWQVLLAGRLHSSEDGWTGTNLDAIEVSGQQVALDMIASAKDLAWTAHNIYSLATGNILTGIDKLTQARAQQLLNPTRPTQHNSPGRATMGGAA
jgi:hypothetical protein